MVPRSSMRNLTTATIMKPSLAVRASYYCPRLATVGVPIQMGLGTTTLPHPTLSMLNGKVEARIVPRSAENRTTRRGAGGCFAPMVNDGALPPYRPDQSPRTTIYPHSNTPASGPSPKPHPISPSSIPSDKPSHK